MLKFALRGHLHLLGRFHVDKFGAKDYQTMCSLIKEKYPIYNESIELHKDIRLLDEKNKLIGIYEASEARRKATTMKKDIVLVNVQSTPAVCKIINFRESILKKFYDEIVIKRNEQLIKKASSTKQLKIPLNLNDKQFQIKQKQLLELAKKNYNVRIFMNCKASQSNDALSKMENLKSMIQNKCIIEKDVKFEEASPDNDESEDGKPKTEQKFTYSMVIKSRENQFMNLLSEGNEKEPETAIEAFLKRYYKQEDVEMRDLQATADLEIDSMIEEIQIKAQVTAKKVETESNIKSMGFSQQMSEQQIKILKQEHSYDYRQAKARILNERLRRILSSM